MRIAACLLVACVPAWSSPSREAIQFRLLKSPRDYLRGWALAVDTDGIRLERFGNGRRLFVPWAAMLREDARRLRLRFEIDWIKNAEPERIAGQRLILEGGGHLDGLLVRRDKQERYWLRARGLVLPYPADRVARVEEIQLLETEVYNKQEIYLRRLERRPPETAAEHRDLADYMFDLGNWARAAEHYAAAVRGQKMWAPELDARVAEIRDIMADAASSRVFSKAKYWAALHSDYARARQLIEGYTEHHPDARRRGIKVLDQVREMRQRRLAARFTRVKHEEFGRAVQNYLLRRKPTLAAALVWLKQEMAVELAQRIRRRLGLQEGEYADLKQAQATGAPHFATYWSGTHIVSHRTRKAKAKVDPKADPEAWWGAYESATHASWLKAYAAEHMPELFRVVNIMETPCSRCGGKGLVKKLAFMPAKGQPNEWMELCPRCHGTRADRGVAYR